MAPILLERTGYEITFLEYEHVNIDEYELSEMNEYIDDALSDIYRLTAFIHTSDIDAFNAEQCAKDLISLSTYDGRSWDIYIYEKNEGDIMLLLFDDKDYLKMKESDSSEHTLRGDNYLDDKILIRMEFNDYSLEYGPLVDNVYCE